MIPEYPFDIHLPLRCSHIDDLKMAATKMSGAKRRSYLAEMAVKYCDSSPRKTETMFGWGRHTVQLGLHEKRPGITCLGTQSACCGRKLWEIRHPEAAALLLNLAESHSQQDPAFRTTLSYTRLTSAEAIKQLHNNGFSEDEIPSLSTMAEFLNRSGYRLKAVIKARPQKKFRKPI